VGGRLRRRFAGTNNAYRTGGPRFRRNDNQGAVIFIGEI
jgi:hypothetical protein